MLVSFTQTYGSGRDELIDIYFRDKRLIELKNLCDHNIYSFHNCQKSTIEKFRQMSEGVIKNSRILEFNNTKYFGREQWFDDGYTETINELMIHLRDIGCTHFFFSQDDTFSSTANKDIDWGEFIGYIKEHDRDFMINLFHTNVSLDYEGFNPSIEKKETFEVYKTTTTDFEETACYWPMDDGPFICTMDVLEDVYDEDYLSFPIICMAEKHLRDKYAEKKMNRFVTNKRSFLNYNIFGPNSHMKTLYRNMLKLKELL